MSCCACGPQPSPQRCAWRGHAVLGVVEEEAREAWLAVTLRGVVALSLATSRRHASRRSIAGSAPPFFFSLEALYSLATNDLLALALARRAALSLGSPAACSRQLAASLKWAGAPQCDTSTLSSTVANRSHGVMHGRQAASASSWRSVCSAASSTRRHGGERLHEPMVRSSGGTAPKSRTSTRAVGCEHEPFSDRHAASTCWTEAAALHEGGGAPARAARAIGREVAAQLPRRGAGAEEAAAHAHCGVAAQRGARSAHAWPPGDRGRRAGAWRGARRAAYAPRPGYARARPERERERCGKQGHETQPAPLSPRAAAQPTICCTAHAAPPPAASPLRPEQVAARDGSGHHATRSAPAAPSAAHGPP
eukprot:scaffold14308_cov68-Phaeocystis_antarctica.AAC.3